MTEPLLPPLRGLDKNAGEVDSGVIGGRRRHRNRGGRSIIRALAWGVLLFAASGLLALIVTIALGG